MENFGIASEIALMWQNFTANSLKIMVTRKTTLLFHMMTSSNGNIFRATGP